MRFRKLRIAFSATCLIACVLLIVLWVRSFWRLDTFIIYRNGNWYGVDSAWGVLHINVMMGVGVPNGWFHRSDPLEETHFPRFVFTWFGRFGGPVFNAHCSTWIPGLFIAMLAAAPWTHQIPKRFSLRTLLITTTLVAVVLGLIVWLR